MEEIQQRYFTSAVVCLVLQEMKTKLTDGFQKLLDESLEIHALKVRISSLWSLPETLQTSTSHSKSVCAARVYRVQ
eukprot:3601838-Amphidinium_carterae.1